MESVAATTVVLESCNLIQAKIMIFRRGFDIVPVMKCRLHGDDSLSDRKQYHLVSRASFPVLSSRAHWARFLITNLCWHEQRKRNLLHNREKSGSVEIVGGWIQKSFLRAGKRAKIYLPLIIWCGCAVSCTSVVCRTEWWCKQMLQFTRKHAWKIHGNLWASGKLSFEDKFM